MRPDSVVEDLPISIGGWAPRNDNGEYLRADADAYRAGQVR